MAKKIQIGLLRWTLARITKIESEIRKVWLANQLTWRKNGVELTWMGWRSKP